MNDMTQKSLKELADILSTGTSLYSAAQVANAAYEIEFRQEMTEVMAKGGDRPPYNPPNP